MRRKFRHLCEMDAMFCKCIQQIVRSSEHEASAPPACGVNSAQCSERVPEPQTSNTSPSPPPLRRSPSKSGITLPHSKSHCAPPARPPQPPPPRSTPPAPELCAQTMNSSQSSSAALLDNNASPKHTDGETQHAHDLSSVQLSLRIRIRVHPRFYDLHDIICRNGLTEAH